MFDLNENKEENQKHKYIFKICQEYSEKELLAMEKEMLGIYISGHPLEKLRQEIVRQTNIDTVKMKEVQEAIENGTNPEFSDGQIVKYAGIVNSVKKKYTKKNTLMAFVTVEDLFGQAEIIVFENTYMSAQNFLMEGQIVLITGRLSIREDEEPKIVAMDIKELGEKKEKKLVLDIREANEETREKLRGAIRFFMGDRNNIKVEIIDNDGTKPSGAIFMIKDTAKQFADILGEDKVLLEGI